MDINLRDQLLDVLYFQKIETGCSHDIVMHMASYIDKAIEEAKDQPKYFLFKTGAQNYKVIVQKGGIFEDFNVSVHGWACAKELIDALNANAAAEKES